MNFDAADNWCLNVATMKVLNVQDDNPSIQVQNFIDHFVLVFDLTLIRKTTGKIHYRELVGKPLRLKLTFTFHLEHVTELSVSGERRSQVAVDKLGVVGKNI